MKHTGSTEGFDESEKSILQYRKEPQPGAYTAPRCIYASILILTLVCLAITVSIFALNIRHKEQTTTELGGPYGFTVYTIFRQETVASLKQLHIDWIRYQLNWSDIEPQSGQYNWKKLDAVVALANANNIHITFPIQVAPEWALSQTCANRKFLPGPTQTAHFAQTVAQRYDNQHGHGYIDSYEVGNEEFDSLWTGDWDESIACRQPAFYGPVLKATYLAIKQASPQALVGMNSMWWVNTPHVHDYMNWLYQNGYKQYFDFANFHYYICNGDPSKTQQDHPSFTEEWQTIHSVMQQYQDGAKPIWVTETGWNINAVDQDPKCMVSPQQQAQYLVETTQAAMDSHVIHHIFWYTIDRGNDGMSITQLSGNPPSFSALQDFIQRHPTWNF